MYMDPQHLKHIRLTTTGAIITLVLIALLAAGYFLYGKDFTKSAPEVTMQNEQGNTYRAPNPFSGRQLIVPSSTSSSTPNTVTNNLLMQRVSIVNKQPLSQAERASILKRYANPTQAGLTQVQQDALIEALNTH